MTVRHVALAHVVEFACLGAACEDTCCAGWTITLDEADHRKLRARLVELGEQAKFDDRVRRPRVGRTPTRFAVLDQRADRSCKFLEADRRCEIHRRLGEDLLPTICAQYPRKVSHAGARVEITATVSCPEVARRALLSDAGTELVACDPAVAGRGTPAQSVPPDVRSPYAAALDPVRGAMYAALSRPDYPVATRLFACAELGDRLDAFLVDETTDADPARLPAEIARLEDDAVLAALDRRWRDARVPAELAPSVVIQVVAERLRGEAPAAFRALFGEVVRAIAAAGGGITLAGDDLDGAQVSAPALAHHLEARRAAAGDRLDPYVARYSRNWVMQDWFVFAPSLAIHVQRHLVRVAITRFLLLAHPRLVLDDPAALDRLAVEVFYATARALEHSDELVAKIVDAQLGAIPSLAAAAALLRI